jgi:uncharacterized protein (TIGR00251 family)
MLERRPEGWSLRVHVQPGASRSEICGRHGDALKVRLAAPPIEGRANKALIEFLAREFDVPRRAIALVSGDHGRDKRLMITAETFDPERLAGRWPELTVTD